MKSSKRSFIILLAIVVIIIGIFRLLDQNEATISQEPDQQSSNSASHQNELVLQEPILIDSEQLEQDQLDPDRLDPDQQVLAPIEQEPDDESTKPAPPSEPVQITDEIHSKQAILIDLEKEQVIAHKAVDERTFPASLTKIMTVILAIEQLASLEEMITLDPGIFDPLYEKKAAMAGFFPNETVKAIDLLYGAMLPSGAEASIGLAMHIADSEENYAKLMNEKALELGMVNTHFTNVTGLHDPNHYSTAQDLALLVQYALKNETFREVFTTSRYSTASSNKHPSGFTMSSTALRSSELTQFEGGEISGGKTGFTNQAGLCLASLAHKNGKEYLLITTGAEGNLSTEQYNFMDARYIYNTYLP